MKILPALITILIPSFLMAGQVPTVCHNELSAWIKDKQPLSIVDIQDADGFRAHNYARSIATANDPARLNKVGASLRTTGDKVVVVSPTGGSDALQAVEELVRSGVRRSRILVLEGGMEAAARKASCDCCKPVSLSGVKQ